MKRRGRISACIGLAAGLTATAVLSAAACRPAYAMDGLGAAASPTAAASPGAAASPAPPPPPGTMKVVPAEGKASAAPARKKRRSHPAAEVEPARARLKIAQDTWIFAGPSKWAKHVLHAPAGKYVKVTGATRYYLRVKLKNGATAYIPASAVELVTPTDKLFLLTSDAPVLAKPNRWAEKIAEVHKGHNVHVIGIALDYMQIRMKSGLAGFITAAALQ